jgi:hypothetical protein
VTDGRAGRPHHERAAAGLPARRRAPVTRWHGPCPGWPGSGICLTFAAHSPCGKAGKKGGAVLDQPGGHWENGAVVTVPRFAHGGALTSLGRRDAGGRGAEGADEPPGLHGRGARGRARGRPDPPAGPRRESPASRATLSTGREWGFVCRRPSNAPDRGRRTRLGRYERVATPVAGAGRRPGPGPCRGLPPCRQAGSATGATAPGLHPCRPPFDRVQRTSPARQRHRRGSCGAG